MCLNELLAKIYRKFTGNKGIISYFPKGKDWMFGSGNMDTETYLEDGNFSLYRSVGELQRRSDDEKMACVNFSANNCLEEIMNYLSFLVKNGKATDEQKEIVKILEYFEIIKNGEANISDRFGAKASGTSWRGNNFKSNAETIRTKGFVAEHLWPYVSTWNEYYKEIDKSIFERAKKILDFLHIGYEFVYQANFSQSGKTSPVQSQVHAWGIKRNDIYIRTSSPNNHAICRDYEKPGEYHGICDSYDPFDKKVAWDFDMKLGVIWSIRLKKPLNVFNKAEISELKKRGFDFIQLPEMNGEVYELGEDCLIKKTVGEMTSEGIRALEKDGKLIGISNANYNKLFI